MSGTYTIDENSKYPSQEELKHAKIYTLAEITRPYKEERKRTIREGIKNGTIEQEEILEIVKMLSEKWQYYHQHYWGMVIKTIIAAVALLTVPYVLITENGSLVPEILLIAFPLIGGVAAVFAIMALKSEEAQIHNIDLKIKSLLESLSENYADFSMNIFSKQSFVSMLNNRQAMNLVLFPLGALGVAAIIEIILILTGNFIG
jgi:hypothetical protein